MYFKACLRSDISFHSRWGLRFFADVVYVYVYVYFFFFF